ncbi:hypothetical protein FACS1894152_7390 [Bacilli bacterium]|nr:hypothetical protein FACS1894152_7390 [Bacilli bacterium]
MTTLTTEHSLNQFATTSSRGLVREFGGIKTVVGILQNANSSQITTCGDMVKLVNKTGSKTRNFAEVTATDTSGYGFVSKTVIQSDYRTGDNMDVCRNYSVIVGVATRLPTKTYLLI